MVQASPGLPPLDPMEVPRHDLQFQIKTSDGSFYTLPAFPDGTTLRQAGKQFLVMLLEGRLIVPARRTGELATFINPAQVVSFHQMGGHR